MVCVVFFLGPAMKRDQIECLKNNANIDVRLPDQLKAEFLDRYQAEGVSASAVIRSMMIDYILAQPRHWSAMLAGLKERVMKRSKWIAGVAGGALASALAAMSLVFAPMAAAEEVTLIFEVSFAPRDGGHYTWQGDFEAAWNERVVIYPETLEGSRYGLAVMAQSCDALRDLMGDFCEVVFQLELLELDVEPDGNGGINVLTEDVISNPRVLGSMDTTMGVTNEVSETGGTFFANVLVAEFDPEADLKIDDSE
jgi:hypothetical protein